MKATDLESPAAKQAVAALFRCLDSAVERGDRVVIREKSEQGRAMTSVAAGRLAGHPGVSRKLLGPADRYMVGLPATLLGTTLIRFVTIGGQLLDMERRIGGLHTEVDGVRTEVRKEIGSRAKVREEIGELSERMTRIETLLATHLAPASNARDPAGL